MPNNTGQTYYRIAIQSPRSRNCGKSHRTLKELLQKQKGGIAHGKTPREQLSLALFTLNFLILDAHGHSAADHHAATKPMTNADVKWKDVLTGEWCGPDPVISRSRGAVCVFPQNQDNPIWVPERLTCKLPPALHEDEATNPTITTGNGNPG